MATIINNGINWGIDQPINTQYTDSPNLDSFSRLRVSNPTGVFDAQFTYDLNSLLYEPITSGTGATVTHDSTNRCALMTFSSTPTGGKAYLQSYDYFRYQPGKSQLVFITFNMIEGVTDVLKFAGYSDGVNGIEFRLNGTTKQVAILSGSSAGNEIVDQDDWNLDKLDGTGASGLTLDIATTNIFIIDFQALYVGRVRVGFDIGGIVIYCHEFLHANISTYPYIQTANLPIRVGMTCTGTVSTTMNFICTSVISEGGRDIAPYYGFSVNGSVTAGSGTRTHLLSVRPRLTFNGITTRCRLQFLELNLIVKGNNPVYTELCIGQALTTPTYNNVNTTYSAFEYAVAQTLSGNPSVVFSSFYTPATNQQKAVSNTVSLLRYPITLDAAGLQRDNGTLSVLVTGIGGTSACSASLIFAEDR